MTKQEIIEETVNHYNNFDRGTTKDGGYAYRNADGNCCAVGRCMTADNIEIFGNFSQGVFDLESKLYEDLKYESLDEILEERYKGHELDFWRDLQGFHDNDGNWNQLGITHDGSIARDELMRKWKD